MILEKEYSMYVQLAYRIQVLLALLVMQSPIFRRKGYVNEAIDFRVIGNSSAALDQQNYSNE